MDLEKKAIERIQLASEMSLHHYEKPLICTYSGGKDSDVMLELFKRSGIPFEVHNSHTTADSPETVYHIRKVFRELELQGIKANIEKPTYQGKSISMWTLIPIKRMPPTRRARYCCQILKETGCPNRMIATGVRWAESKGREDRESFEAIGSTKDSAIRVSDEKMLLSDNDKTRQLFEKCELKAKTVVNPIIDWPDSDIWDFYWNECGMHNPSYECGLYRVGCVGCPLATSKIRHKEFAMYPKYQTLYIHAFDRMIRARKDNGLNVKWKSGEEVFLWWIEDPNIDGQVGMEFDGMDMIGYTEKGN